MDESALIALLSGGTAWDAYRRSIGRSSNPDLAGAGLADATLLDADLSYANLKGAILVNADLASANLAAANLTVANLTAADLTRANLTRANLTRATLFGAALFGAELAAANLSNADLTGANLTGANLTYAHLFGASLAGANLAGVNLTGAKLTGANLAGADLTGANLTGVEADSRLEISSRTVGSNGQSMYQVLLNRPRTGTPEVGVLRIQTSDLGRDVEPGTLADLGVAVSALADLSARVGASLRQRIFDTEGGGVALLTATPDAGQPVAVRRLHFGSPWYVDVWDAATASSPYLAASAAGVFFGRDRISATILWLAFPSERRRRSTSIEADIAENELRRATAIDQQQQLILDPVTPGELRERLASAGVDDGELDQLTTALAPIFRHRLTLTTSSDNETDDVA